MNVLDYAIRIEREGETLFERMARSTDDPGKKEICELLLSAEQEHIGRLLELKRHVDPSDARSSMVERAWRVSGGFSRLLDKSDFVHGLPDDWDGFLHIVKAEEENIEMLEGMAYAEPNRNAGMLLATIAEEEREHLNRMENIYDFVESPRTYLEWGEFSNLRRL